MEFIVYPEADDYPDVIPIQFVGACHLRPVRWCLPPSVASEVAVLRGYYRNPQCVLPACRTLVSCNSVVDWGNRVTRTPLGPSCGAPAEQSHRQLIGELWCHNARTSPGKSPLAAAKPGRVRHSALCPARAGLFFGALSAAQGAPKAPASHAARAWGWRRRPADRNAGRRCR